MFRHNCVVCREHNRPSLKPTAIDKLLLTALRPATSQASTVETEIRTADRNNTVPLPPTTAVMIFTVQVMLQTDLNFETVGTAQTVVTAQTAGTAQPVGTA